MTILSWSLEPALLAHLVPKKFCSFPMEIFTPQPRHPFYSSLWSPQHFWCITLSLPQTMAILCLRDSLYPSSQALSGTSHPILLREQRGYTHGYPEANQHPYPPWVSTHPCGYGYVCGLVGISHGFTHYCHCHHYHLS